MKKKNPTAKAKKERLEKMIKEKLKKHPSYDLVPETSGKITDSVWIRKDKKVLIIDFAWGDNLIFGPEEEINKRK